MFVRGQKTGWGLGFEPRLTESESALPDCFVSLFFTKWVLTRSFRIKGLGPIYKAPIALRSAHIVAISSISIFPI